MAVLVPEGELGVAEGGRDSTDLSDGGIERMFYTLAVCPNRPRVRQR